MADNILRLKVESSEYDAKLKKAAEGIRHLAEVAHQSDGMMTGLEKSELDFINSLGEMSTKSKTAAGSLRELESVYKELKVVYDQLNDVEKADEGGRALAASLEQIKQRAQEARAQMDNASKSLQDNGNAGKESSSILSQLASKFTVNIDALKLFDMGLKAVNTALNVAKEAFFASETNVDEWGRTMRSAEGIYQSFLQSLNTGDFSSFLNNIGQVTQAAREAYNALDELGTRMTIINPERAKLQARQQELRADIRRNGADSEVGKAALAELKKIEPLLSKSFKTESQMNYTAFEKLVRERLAEGGINLNQKSFAQFMKTFSSDAAFQNLRRNARGSVTTEMTGNAFNPNAAMTRRTVDTRNIEQKLLDLFTDEWRKANSGYLTASFSAQGAAASNALGNARYMKTGGGGGGGGRSGGGNNTIDYAPDSIAAQQALVSELTKQWNNASEAMRDGYLKDLMEAEETLKRMKDAEGMKRANAKGLLLGKAEDIDMSYGGGFSSVNPFAEGNKAMEMTGTLKLQLDENAMNAVNEQILNQMAKDGKAVEESWKSAGSAIGTVSGAISQIENPAAKIIGTIGQAIATIALAYAETLAKDKSSKSNIYAFIAAAAATTISLATTIASIHNSTGYAEGGIIKGNSFSGDMIPADSFVNAGELVLNRAQQGALASMIRDNERNGGGSGVSYITGEQICVVIDRYLARTGRGELVTWK